MPDLSEYKAEHLFLLIGKNPLPNYVAAKLLIKRGAKVCFVYSERTGDSILANLEHSHHMLRGNRRRDS
jgi:hypothetical protein